MKALFIVVLSGALLALPGPVRAQPVLRLCIDEERPASARVEACSRVIAASSGVVSRTPAAFARAEALLGRAQARLRLVDEAQDDPPPSAYDPIVLDLEDSYRTFRSEGALSLGAAVRFQRGDFAAELLPLFRRGEWEEVARRLGPMIAAEPRNTDLLLLRSTLRMLTGDMPGGLQDRQAAVQIASSVP